MTNRLRRSIALILLGAIILLATVLLRPPPSLSGLKTTPWQYASFPVMEFKRYSSPFGMRKHPISTKRKMHKGQDIAAPEGSDIVAWWGGKVILIGFDPDGWGNYVVIRSGQWEHLYAHCSKIVVRKGQTVKTKAVIARIGQTGGATGPHLHWELRHQLPNQKNITDSSQWQLINPAEVLWLMYKATYPKQPSIKPTAFSSETYRGEILETY